MTIQTGWNSEYNQANGTLLIGNGTRPVVGTLTAGAGISVVNGAGTITITNTGGGGASASLSPYIVGTTGTNDFATIQAAITQAIADGATDGNPLNIYVKPGVYNEALTTAAGIRLLAASWDLQDVNLGNNDPAVNFTGTIDHSTGSLSIIGFKFSGNNGATPIIQNDGASEIRITGCFFECTGTGPLVSTSGTASTTNLIVQNCTFESTNTSLLDITDGSLVAIFFDSWINSSNFDLTTNAGVVLSFYRCKIGGSPVQVIIGASVVSGSFEIIDCDFFAAATTFIDASANANPQTVLIERSLLRSSAPFCILNNVSICTINNCDTTFAEPCTTAATSTISNSTFNPGALPIASGILQVSQTFNGTSELTRLILTDEFHGTYSERFHGVGQTVGLGSVNLATIPILTNEVVSVKCNVACNDGAFAGGASGNVEAGARRAGGGAILVSSFTNINGEGSLVGATIIPQVIGNNLLIDTVGIFGVTMNWSIDYEVLHVQSDA